MSTKAINELFDERNWSLGAKIDGVGKFRYTHAEWVGDIIPWKEAHAELTELKARAEKTISGWVPKLENENEKLRADLDEANRKIEQKQHEVDSMCIYAGKVEKRVESAKRTIIYYVSNGLSDEPGKLWLAEVEK